MINKRCKPNVVEVVADRWESVSLFVVSDVPGASLWGGDRLGALDTVSGRTGQKEALGDVAGNIFFLSGASQISLGDGLGDATVDAIRMHTDK
jgi:hypothetical protein